MTETAATADSPPAPSVRCLQCEYDLRGLPREANCPECGITVEPSWQRREAELAGRLPPLHQSGRAWLRAMALACCLTIGVALLESFGALRMVTGGGRSFNIAGVVVGMTNLGVTLVGVWLFGVREPLRPTGRAGSGGSAPSRYAIRAIAVAVVVLPFALAPMMNRFGTAPNFFRLFSVAFAALSGVATWVAMRRLAAAARRDGRPVTARVATGLAWLAPPAWVTHAFIDSTILLGEHHYWHLNANPVTGYVESIIVIPGVVIAIGRWDRGLLPWVPEALMSIAAVLVLATMAPVLLAAARRSPHQASAQHD